MKSGFCISLENQTVEIGYSFSIQRRSRVRVREKVGAIIGGESKDPLQPLAFAVEVKVIKLHVKNNTNWYTSHGIPELDSKEEAKVDVQTEIILQEQRHIIDTL